MNSRQSQLLRLLADNLGTVVAVYDSCYFEKAMADSL